MVQEVTVAEVYDILHSEAAGDYTKKEFVCDGTLKEYEVRTTVNGKPYVSMTFSDGNKQIVTQYFYKDPFDETGLSKAHNYRLYGTFKKSAMGFLFFNLKDAPREKKSEKTNRSVIDDIWLYPVLADEFSDVLTGECLYPIFWADLDAGNPESDKIDEHVQIENKKTTNKDDFVDDLVGQLLLKFQKDHVTVSVPVDGFKKLFEFAIDAGEIERDDLSKSLEYAKQLAMNIEFQLMLNGVNEVTDDVIKVVINETFGIFTSDATTNSLYEQDEIEILENKNSLSDDDEQIVIGGFSVNDKDDSQDEPSEILAQAQNDYAPPVLGKGYDSLYDALKNSGGRVPQKRDDQGQYIDDIEEINIIESKLPTGEKILYASDFVHVGLVNEKMIKRKRNDFFEIKLKNTDYLMLIITENQVICTNRYKYTQEIRFFKRDITSVDGIYVKSGLLSLKDSQIQIRLNDDRWFVINKFFTGEEKYNAYLEGLKEVL